MGPHQHAQRDAGGVAGIHDVTATEGAEGDSRRANRKPRGAMVSAS
jgi:hypothetical protein